MAEKSISVLILLFFLIFLGWDFFFSPVLAAWLEEANTFWALAPPCDQIWDIQSTCIQSGSLATSAQRFASQLSSTSVETAGTHLKVVTFPRPSTLLLSNSLIPHIYCSYTVRVHNQSGGGIVGGTPAVAGGSARGKLGAGGGGDLQGPGVPVTAEKNKPGGSCVIGGNYGGKTRGLGSPDSGACWNLKWRSCYSLFLFPE